MNKHYLALVLDAIEYMLHLVTLGGAAILAGYAVYQTITEAIWPAVASLLVAGLLLAINVAMRTGTVSRKGGG